MITALAIAAWHDRRDFLGSFLGLVMWGGAQQWVLQTAVLRDCQRAAGRTAGLGVAAHRRVVSETGVGRAVAAGGGQKRRR